MANDSAGGADSGDGGNRSVLNNAVRYLGLMLQVFQRSFPQIVGTSGTAVAGAATLPANPVGFITITLPDGTSAKVPYYA